MMKKEEILKVLKDLNNNFGPEEDVISIEINKIKYNISIEKLKTRYPGIEVSEIHKIFKTHDMELPEIMPQVKGLKNTS